MKAAKAAKLEIIVQSPMGGNITVEEIAAKIPAGAESVFVRVDQISSGGLRVKRLGLSTYGEVKHATD